MPTWCTQLFWKLQVVAKSVDKAYLPESLHGSRNLMQVLHRGWYITEMFHLHNQLLKGKLFTCSEFIFIAGTIEWTSTNFRSDLFTLIQQLPITPEISAVANTFSVFHFYPGPGLAFGYCRCLRLFVCVCVSVCQSVCPSLACPCHNSRPVSVRTTKFGPRVQNNLVRYCFVEWSILILKVKFKVMSKLTTFLSLSKP